MDVSFLLQKVPVRLLTLCLFCRVVTAAPCIEDTLQNYVGLGAGGCTIGSVEFANFTLLPPLYTEIDPSVVRLVPTLYPGFLVTLNATAAAGEIVHSTFSFTGTGMQFGQAGMGLIGSVVEPDGVNTAVGIFTPGDVAIAFDIGVDAELFALATFPATGSILAELDFTVDAGLSGSAALAQGEVRFGDGLVVPEPSTFGLTASAAIGLLGALQWKRRTK